MKVLIVHPAFNVYGGAELAIVKFIEYLHKNNVEVDLLTNIMDFSVRRDLRKKCKIKITQGNDLFKDCYRYVQQNFDKYDYINR